MHKTTAFVLGFCCALSGMGVLSYLDHVHNGDVTFNQMCNDDGGIPLTKQRVCLKPETIEFVGADR